MFSANIILGLIGHVDAAASVRWQGKVTLEYSKRIACGETGVSGVSHVPDAPPSASSHLGQSFMPVNRRKRRAQPGHTEHTSSSEPHADAELFLVPFRNLDSDGGFDGDGTSQTSSSVPRRSGSLSSFTSLPSTASGADTGLQADSQTSLQLAQLQLVPTPLRSTLFDSCDSRHRNSVRRACSQVFRDNHPGCAAQEMHPQFLADRLHKVEQQRDDAKREVKRLKRQNAALQKQVAQAHATHLTDNAAAALEVSRRGTHRLSQRGAIALGIRKSLALTSAIGYPLAALIDISRWTVIRCEVAVAAMLVARARARFINCFFGLCSWLRNLRVLRDLLSRLPQSTLIRLCLMLTLTSSVPKQMRSDRISASDTRCSPVIFLQVSGGSLLTTMPLVHLALLSRSFAETLQTAASGKTQSYQD